MAGENIDVLPVLSNENNHVIGILSYQNIIAGYQQSLQEHTTNHPNISIKRRSLKILIRGQKLINSRKVKDRV
jgi:predicted transcriptional regulator